MNRFFKFFLFSVFFICSFYAHATNEEVCNRFLNNGWYADYKYAGLYPYKRAIKDHGVFSGTTHVSVEASTWSVDPKIWSNATTGLAEITSSWGPCSLFAYEKAREVRELYFAQNKNEVMMDIAKGKGEHLNVIAMFSLCERNEFARFASQLQKRIPDFLSKPPSAPYNTIIDDTIRSDDKLSTACYSPPKI